MTAKQINSAKKKVFYFLLWPIVFLLSVWVIYLGAWAHYMSLVRPLEQLGETYMFLTTYSVFTQFIFGGLMIFAWTRGWDQ